MIKNFITPNDLIKTSLDTLKQIVTEFGKTSNGNTTELVASIWVERDKDNFNDVLEKYNGHLFSHRGSYVCYQVTKGNLNDLVDKKIKPLIGKKENVNKSEIRNEPEFIGAYKLNENEYFVKVTYLMRYENRIEDDDIVKIPIIDQTNVLIDIENQIVEIRSNYDKSIKIIDFLHDLNKNIEFKNIEINNESVIKDLKATMTSSKGYRTGADINLDVEGKNAIESIVTFINEALENGDQAVEYDDFLEQIEKLREKEEVNNFVLLLINGLGKLDLGAIFDEDKMEDLNKNSLYNLIKPYIEANTMYLNVPFNNGVLKNYTIKVGLEKNVITYLSTPNENLIRHIRKNIL
ncbi:hypothetical protein HUZ99_04400 [Staphylococcus sp. SS87]|nr:hypothetical protein [Staphylococcus singaporensis]